MVYLITNNRPIYERRRAIITTAIVLIIIVGGIIWRVPHFFPSIFTTIARPFWRIQFSVEEGSLRSPESLLAENEDLKRQLQDLTVRSETTALVISENAELKGLLGRDILSNVNSSSTHASSTSLFASPLPSRTMILAAVLMRPPVTFYDEFIIDIGQDYNLAVGDLVYAPGNILIGKVADVLGDTSRVMLLSSPGSTYDAIIGNNKHVTVTAIGRGGGQYSAEVPRDIVVNEGDIIVAPSLDSKIVGTIRSVISDPTKPFVTILFTPPINIFSSRWVFVDHKEIQATKPDLLKKK